MSKLSRRDFIKTGAMLAGGAILQAYAPQATMAAPAPTSAPTTAAIAPTVSSATTAAAYQGKLAVVSWKAPEAMAPMIKAIEEAYPGVSVEWRNFSQDKYVQLFTAADLAGDQIDVMDMTGQEVRRFAFGGRLMDSSNLPYLNRFTPSALNCYTLGGKVWAVPRAGVGGYGFFYNKKILDKIGYKGEPQTYDDLKTIAPDLKKLGVAPVIHWGKQIYWWPVWYFFAHNQTTQNKATDHLVSILSGDKKFTDPECVAALEIVNKFVQDGMFHESTLSLERADCWSAFARGAALFLYESTTRIGDWVKQKKDLTDLDLSIIPPLCCVPDSTVIRQNPGGPADAVAIYAKIAPERLEIARAVQDLITTDKWTKWACDLDGAPLSVNVNAAAADEPVAVKFAKDLLPNQTIYEDWIWPPEVNATMQQNIQALIGKATTPAKVAADAQAALDKLFKSGYKFQG